MRWPRAANALLLAVLAVGSASARSKPTLAIAPGPSVQSPSERALVADPAAGREHAVILVEETSLDEAPGLSSETSYHLRAKILSNNGRRLADIEIPHTSHGKLKTWWARTILPDGRVLELPRDQLASQTVLEVGRRFRPGRLELRAFKAALPGVEPGAVIDYGYVLVDAGFQQFRRVPIQRRWPVQSLRFRWAPNEYLGSAYKILNGTGYEVEARAERGVVIVTAANVPALVEEPAMPPLPQVQLAALFYYFTPGTDFDQYWDDQARSVETWLKQFLSKDKPIRDVIASWGVPGAAGLRERLHRSYEWVATHVRDTGTLSAEELEASPTREEEEERSDAAAVMQRGEGSRYEVAALFAGFARALGAEANLVLTSDRRESVWDPGIHSLAALDYGIVAVRTPTEGDDRVVLVDPGSGLPYGTVPWWATGITALITSASGARMAHIPPGDPRQNVGTTRVLLAFSEDAERVLADWTRTGSGQVTLAERRHLRRLAPAERQKRLDELCGSSATAELFSAEAKGLESATSELVVSCSVEVSGTNLDNELTEYRFSFAGPWIEPVLELGSSATRVHPIELEFPRVENAVLEISAPTGFAPAAAPAPIALETPYGTYRLSVLLTPYGYRIERTLGMHRQQVPASEYGALRAFLDDVRRADRTPLTFRRSGTP